MLFTTESARLGSARGLGIRTLTEKDNLEIVPMLDVSQVCNVGKVFLNAKLELKSSMADT